LIDFDVIIIGGGASGLMCALTAGQRGRKVLVLDRSRRVGKKILVSGGGRCNFTNLFITPDCYLSANPDFCISALARYTQWDFLEMVEKHGIPYEEREQGQLFCRNSAKDILNMLLAECEQADVNIETCCDIKSIEAIQPEGNVSKRFVLTTHKSQLSASALVVATGGLSIPKMGATGYGYDIARQFGMRVIPPRAGLVPFVFSDGFKAVSDRLSGLSLEVALRSAGKAFCENVLFTHRGLSGPAVLQLSNYWQSGECIQMDVLPGTSLESWLKKQKQNSPKMLLRNLLAQRLPKRLVLELQVLFWQPWAETPIAEMPDSELLTIANSLHHWALKPSGTEGFRTAEVTLGGVDTDGLSSKTMESKVQQGMYFIGEVVDVTGHLGGFNFQWAWSSAHAAGLCV
jgi:predicted Rossmann fold flavoprotein